MNIKNLRAQAEIELEAIQNRRRKAKTEIEMILDRALKEGRSNLTTDEQNRSDELFIVIDQSKTQERGAKDKLARVLQVEADDAHLDAQMALPPIPAVHARSNAASTVQVGRTANATVTSRADSPVWTRQDGLPAVLERGQSIASHPAMQRQIAVQAEADKHVVGMHGSFGQMLRSMSTSSASAVVPQIWATDIIDRARNATVAYQAGATTVPMDAKTVNVARLLTDPAPSFKSEGSTITPSDLTFDNVTLVATTLSCLTVVSREFLQDAIDAPDLITEAVAKSMALELDKAVFYGQLAAGNEPYAATLASPYPRGILQTLLSFQAANVLGGATNGTAQTTASYWNELINLVYTPMRLNERVSAIVSNAQGQQQYAMAYDTTGQPLRMPPVLNDVPWLVTNMIPSFTSGTMTSRATDVFAGDFSQVLIGERMNMDISILQERYAEAGQVGILAYGRYDVQVARPKALACYRYLQGAL